MTSLDPTADYPFSSVRPDLVGTPSGLALEDLTLEGLRAGRISKFDVRVTPSTLRLQANVARQAGRAALAENLERSAELAAVPDDVILDLYSSLRPGRSNRSDLEGWAARLEREFDAPLVAAFVREAIQAYGRVGILS